MVTLPDFSLRLLLAVLLGTLIGLERQRRGSLAGLRTNALVSVSSAMFVVIASLEPGTLDHTRIAAQVVSGVGFLGAGAILREGLSVRGLNTAATLWSSAAVGCLAGLGFVLEASVGAGLVFLGHPVLRRMESTLDVLSARKEKRTGSRLELDCAPQDENWVRRTLLQDLEDTGSELQGVQVRRTENTVHFILDVSHPANVQPLGQLMRRLALDGSVQRVACQTPVTGGGLT
ncbi:MgtC/SapB family protein [Deinococcus cellulosilyticus]|uniref:MgtC/SapB/SrpB/YhiD N-terminal domain-containing protein n=1 Tax=Deinococcus cellulosilyticus (strain DSM 18568 / NBRC 106333 / KACC 11606 / 5516J-15) TaxID=1223518 RepID=A0A511N766_DEIC1|nr:MgtC/SapB family protein [Deinococcus cellulosilyticus]GEM48327.1 hypothetical protein DC3_39620 [Deinococcus cellulosilyticus NBRC 106333 = KACC 11606]